MSDTVKLLERKCTFCDIIKSLAPIHTTEEKARTSELSSVLLHNEDLAVFRDHRPTVVHHYLVIPCWHVKNPKALSTQEHIDLIKNMFQFGKQFLIERGLCDANNVEVEGRFGFHYPPFISEEHLHLHVLFPASKVTSRKYKKNSWFFRTPSQLIEEIEKKIKTQTNQA